MSYSPNIGNMPKSIEGDHLVVKDVKAHDRPPTPYHEMSLIGSDVNHRIMPLALPHEPTSSYIWLS